MEIQTHFLYPATLFAHKEPHVVSTILGSCVAVCLWDPTLQIGGINHYMLPLWNGQGLASPKYGNIAIEKLIERMLQMGSKKSNLKAKVFGGGEVIETQISHFQIGERNIVLAMESLKDEKIPIISQSVGGKLGRKIQYNTQTGAVLHKFIEKQAINQIDKAIGLK
ncbi:MAG: chemotaxis protein CheD [Bacteroidales bacterium]|nr:chemotaxis protein CheD [Bacteroidales bacterium]